MTWSTLAGQKIESHLLHWFKLKPVTLLLLYYFYFFIFFDVCRPDNLMDYVSLSVPGTQLFPPVCVSAQFDPFLDMSRDRILYIL